MRSSFIPALSEGAVARGARLLVLSLCVMTAAAVVTPMAGCEEKVSADKFALLSQGMTLHDVEKVMGGKGERQEVSGMSVSAAGVAGGATSTQEIWVWKAGRKEISVTMVGGKVGAIAKSGF